MLKQDQDTSKQNHSPIQLREVLLPDEHPPIALKMSEESLYLPASTVSPELPAILRSWLHPAPLMRSNRLNVQSGQLSIQRITIVSLVSNQPDREISGKPRCESLSYKLDFMRAGRTRVNGDRNTIAVDHCHDLATLAPLGLSHVPAPLLAVTNVPSMKHSVRSSLPRSRRSSANTFGVLSKTLLICLCPTLRMTHDHPTLIKEAPSELLEHERRHRHSITGSRIRMLRLLKRGEAKSVREAGELIGYSWRHTRRWLTTY